MTNAAYDLSRFDTEVNTGKEKQPVKMEVVRPAVKRGAVAKGLIFSMFVVAVCCAMLFSMVRINELSNQVAYETEVLNKLKSEGVVLETRLDSEMSLANVEDYAVNVLGMQKIETSQMECINIKTENVISKTESDEIFFAFLSNAVSGLMEYLKF